MINISKRELEDWLVSGQHPAGRDVHNMNLTLKNSGLFLLTFAGVVAIGIAGWYLERWINWHYGYEARVRAIVREEISSYVFDF